jgi:hypothetical protein
MGGFFRCVGLEMRKHCLFAPDVRLTPIGKNSLIPTFYGD